MSGKAKCSLFIGEDKTPANAAIVIDFGPYVWNFISTIDYRGGLSRLCRKLVDGIYRTLGIALCLPGLIIQTAKQFSFWNG
ncbi:hypothetical protein [Ruegeria sp. HKCCA4812]|uniref:hypothetical protein n=1 Tax=Ruegeria sp. HKCCA4812 TaxID=2682993 RepID=UPI001489C0EE|nr:hypothetical protein [Ruegeria sp. HKCCA4812]